MARYEVTIPDWKPTSANVMDRHWTVRRRRKRQDADQVALALERAGVPRVAVPVPIRRAAVSGGIDPAELPIPGRGRPPCRRRVALIVTLGPERDDQGRFATPAPDPDNLWKFLRDALVTGGWLYDDTAEWVCSAGDPEVRPDDGAGLRTTITIEDLD